MSVSILRRPKKRTKYGERLLLLSEAFEHQTLTLAELDFYLDELFEALQRKLNQLERLTPDSGDIHGSTDRFLMGMLRLVESFEALEHTELTDRVDGLEFEFERQFLSNYLGKAV